MNQASYIVDVDQTNINEVIQYSLEVPVLLDFWADWCQPCKALAPVLEKLAKEFQGRFVLARVNTDANQMLAQQLGVRSIPALKLVVRGQLAAELNGAQPESEIRRMLEAVVGPAPEAEEAEAGDDFTGQIQRARQMGAYDEALQALQAVVQEQPEALAYQALMAEVLMDMDRLEDAAQVLANINDDKVKAAAAGRLYFLQELQGFESTDSLQYRIANDEKDAEARYYMAANCVLAGEFEAAMELLLQVIMLDRNLKDDGGRKALLKIFDMLGSSDPRVTPYRRRLFTSLH